MTTIRSERAITIAPFFIVFLTLVHRARAPEARRAGARDETEPLRNPGLCPGREGTQPLPGGWTPGRRLSPRQLGREIRRARTTPRVDRRPRCPCPREPRFPAARGPSRLPSRCVEGRRGCRATHPPADGPSARPRTPGRPSH